jgi:hypothetical protein
MAFDAIRTTKRWIERSCMVGFEIEPWSSTKYDGSDLEWSLLSTAFTSYHWELILTMAEVNLSTNYSNARDASLCEILVTLVQIFPAFWCTTKRPFNLCDSTTGFDRCSPTLTEQARRQVAPVQLQVSLL